MRQMCGSTNELLHQKKKCRPVTLLAIPEKLADLFYTHAVGFLQWERTSQSYLRMVKVPQDRSVTQIILPLLRKQAVLLKQKALEILLLLITNTK